jgi:hypothetical protein
MNPILLFGICSGLTSAHTSTMLSTSGIHDFKQKMPLMVSLSNHEAQKFSFLKLILLTTAILLFCSSFCLAADPPQTRPMTRYEKAIANITDPNDLKTSYDTLKTDYDRRYFLNALPGYFKDHNIQTVPDWIEKAVLYGLNNKKPLMVCEAIRTAGALNINYSDNFITLYPSIRTSFGCHEDMLKSSVLASLSRLDNANKKQFYYDILTKEDMPCLSATFNTLLDAIYAEPDQIYAQKLTEYSSTLGTIISQMESSTEKEKDYRLPQYKDLKDKIERLRNRIEKSQQGGGQ